MKNAKSIIRLFFQPDILILRLDPVLLRYPIGYLNTISMSSIFSLTLQNFLQGRFCELLLESPLRYRYKDGTLVS